MVAQPMCRVDFTPIIKPLRGPTCMRKTSKTSTHVEIASWARVWQKRYYGDNKLWWEVVWLLLLLRFIKIINMFGCFLAFFNYFCVLGHSFCWLGHETDLRGACLLLIKNTQTCWLFILLTLTHITLEC